MSVLVDFKHYDKDGHYETDIFLNDLLVRRSMCVDLNMVRFLGCDLPYPRREIHNYYNDVGALIFRYRTPQHMLGDGLPNGFRRSVFDDYNYDDTGVFDSVTAFL